MRSSVDGELVLGIVSQRGLAEQLFRPTPSASTMVE